MAKKAPGSPPDKEKLPATKASPPRAEPEIAPAEEKTPPTSPASKAAEPAPPKPPPKLPEVQNVILLRERAFGGRSMAAGETIARLSLREGVSLRALGVAIADRAVKAELDP